MLSTDELSNGIPFILKLWDSAGTPMQWVQTLRGESARRWYDIYRTSDWDALRREAAGTFQQSVTEDEAETVRHSNRCVVIRTQVVKTEELSAGPGGPLAVRGSEFQIVIAI